MAIDAIPAALQAILGAVIAGGMIGLEREWRGHPAGLRTHILVSLASALLMLAALSQRQWAFEILPGENIVTDPTRMAHGILTGIGFLCAGVIFRTGFSVHGLTTAASLWITSALGILFGSGLYLLGTAGTITTLTILVGLRLLGARVTAKSVIDVELSWDRSEPVPEETVVQALHSQKGHACLTAVALVDDGRTVRQTWRVTAASEPDLSAMAERLGAVARGLTT